MACLPCRRQFHDECHDYAEKDVCCCNGADLTNLAGDEGEDSRPSTGVAGNPQRRLKRDAALSDQQSTGRKRAAKAYPLDRNADCEWRGKTNCGGGPNPIMGCFDGKQQARHHGPDKNTLNNEPGNVHRICHSDHNRWHAANDKDYIPGQPVKAD